MRLVDWLRNRGCLALRGLDLVIFSPPEGFGRGAGSYCEGNSTSQGYRDAVLSRDQVVLGRHFMLGDPLDGVCNGVHD